MPCYGLAARPLLHGRGLRMRVKLSEAAWLVHHHERVVRWHLLPPPTGKGDLPGIKEGHVWTIDTADLERLPVGWHVDRGRLAQLEASDAHTTSRMEARIAALEHLVRQMSRQLDRSREASNTPPDALSGPTEAGGREEQTPAHLFAPDPVTAPFSMTYRAPAAPATFRTHADAGRWLGRHGVPENTSKGWHGWRQVPLEPRSILQDALNRSDPENWRVTWRLHQCDDVLCVCRELLLG